MKRVRERVRVTMDSYIKSLCIQCLKDANVLQDLALPPQAVSSTGRLSAGRMRTYMQRFWRMGLVVMFYNSFEVFGPFPETQSIMGGQTH